VNASSLRSSKSKGKIARRREEDLRIEEGKEVVPPTEKDRGEEKNQEIGLKRTAAECEETSVGRGR